MWICELEAKRDKIILGSQEVVSKVPTTKRKVDPFLDAEELALQEALKESPLTSDAKASVKAASIQCLMAPSFVYTCSLSSLFFLAQCHIEAQASKALQPSRRNSKSSKSTKSSN